ncbi:hypothetical protein HY003_01275 [Candidatus Saccharibacteria bacterium]|nr:hypothetical protein [Candidatus Saccharibacteria bacterium]MBI3337909.1 hypothetical protein [Candidatus Saccharibacteria bacterium]
MEDNEQNHNYPPTPVVQPQAVYPTATVGVFADQPSPSVASAESNQLQDSSTGTSKTTNYTSFVILALLVLTFFTPLGASLFLPLVVVAIFYAYNHTRQSVQTSTTPASTGKVVVHTIFKLIMVACMIFGLGILALTGILFLLVSTGWGDFRMGS